MMVMMMMMMIMMMTFIKTWGFVVCKEEISKRAWGRELKASQIMMPQGRPQKKFLRNFFPIKKIPKLYVNVPSSFWWAKIILRCQNMCHKSGEVISDQLHFKVIEFWVSFVLFWKNECVAQKIYFKESGSSWFFPWRKN